MERIFEYVAKGIGGICLILALGACQKFAPPDPSFQQSAHGDDESHYNGRNCMDCHYSAGYGEGWFSLAGSVYGQKNQSKIHLYNSDDLVNPILNLEVDDRGNVFTTQEIDFSSGLRVSVENSAGKVEWMDEPIFSGQCNLCHGTGIEERITLE